MCRALEVRPAGSDRWRSRKPAARATENERRGEQIKAAQVASRGIDGSPKIYGKLRREGEAVNHKRVARLRRASGLKAKRVKKSKRTTDSRHSLPVAEKVLARDFTAKRPDAVWTADSTDSWTAAGWLYLVVCRDLYWRLVLGWAVAESLAVGFVERAFLPGQSRRGGCLAPLIHSDRGCQDASTAFREKVAAWGGAQSLSRQGKCWDNAVTESFFGNLKRALVDHECFKSRRAATDQLFD
jgi:transposase InsO family protein